VAENSGIQWCDHTFNVVWGCTKVSPGCAGCYAETLAARFGVGWGPAAERRVFGEGYWRGPLTWDARAARKGERARVFCGSMCDVGEEHSVTEREVARLWPLIDRTPNLDWLLLSKRPAVLGDRIRRAGLGAAARSRILAMTSVEDQAWAGDRLPQLLSLEGHVGGLGVSCEPLLGHVCLRPWLMRLDWVIVGGESTQGAHAARPFDVGWAEDLRAQCALSGVAFFLKQLGSHPTVYRRGRLNCGPVPLTLRDSHGGDPEEWPAGLCRREFPRLQSVAY
jgi:protein gp37